MTHENAMRFFQYDPFAHRPEGEGARSVPCGPRPPGVDVSIHSMGRGSGSVTGAMLAEMAKTGPK